MNTEKGNHQKIMISSGEYIFVLIQLVFFYEAGEVFQRLINANYNLVFFEFFDSAHQGIHLMLAMVAVYAYEHDHCGLVWFQNRFAK